MQQICSGPWLESQAARTIHAWHACSSLPIPQGPIYLAREQRRREHAYDAAMRSVKREVKTAPRTQIDRLAAQDRIVATFTRFAVEALDLKEEAVRLITSGFVPAGTEFARLARHFDPALTVAEIVQACRNALTVCGLQPLLNEPIAITPSIVAYSLLYPYTDNFLDRRDVSGQAKRRFCARFRQRLSGVKVAARDRHEAAVWALVEMIEGQYPRACHPQVYDSLLAIHQAQEESIAQLTDGEACSQTGILRISCAKGGSSVLADACLVRGRLGEEEARLAFDWGALLQLGDDLQDVREDLDRGSATLFTSAIAEGKPLDALVSRLLNFIDCVGGELDHFPGGSATLKDLVVMSWRSLVIAAVAHASEFFSPAFLRELERFSPFRFRFLRARNKKLASRQGIFTAAFDALIEEPEMMKRPISGSSFSPFVQPAFQDQTMSCQ